MLGMVFGTGAVIATLSSNEGASRFIQAELKKMGTNIMTVSADPTNEAVLSESHWATIRKYSSLFREAAIINRTEGAEARSGSKLVSVPLMGVDARFFKALNLNLKQGRIFDDEDNSQRRLVALLGSGLKKELFGKGIAVGKSFHVRYGDYAFIIDVIGVLAEKGGAVGSSVDPGLFLPLKTFEKIAEDRSKIQTVMSLTLIDDSKSSLGKAQVLGILKKRFPMGLVVSDAREAIERTKSVWEKQNLVGICLALVSLLTGGVGIMNIMLLSVTQRRKEIGLRKAIGARNSFILLQFLLEAVVVCLLGGALGVLAGLLFGNEVAKLMGQWEAVTSPVTIIMALFFATLVGVVFGLAPAIRASQLDPYDAIRG